MLSTRHLVVGLLAATLSPGCVGTAAVDAASTPFVAVTFNSGTSEGMGHDATPDDGYDGAMAILSDQWYGDGLAWSAAVTATTAFFAETQADVVVFQEVFWSGDCVNIPAAAHTGFVCDDWQPGEPTVAQQVLGPGWQVMCHPGKNDKCAAVRRTFGSFEGCEADFCLEGMTGATVDGCGKGARVGRARIERVGGEVLTLVNVHGSSGLSVDDQQCRRKQVEQVFVDLDGAPAASGDINLIMGDLNTDPGRWAAFDPSAARWGDFVGAGKAFHFITDAGPDSPRSYQGVVAIDHVVADKLAGDCWIAGLSVGHPKVIDAIYFDHKPVVCNLR